MKGGAMTYKLTVIETNLSSFSGDIIFNELIECQFGIIDLRDILLLDYWDKLNYKPIINISEKYEIKEIIIQIFTKAKEYGRDKYLNILDDKVMPMKEYDMFIKIK